MNRTPEQKALLQKVIDWLAAGAPHVKINENITLEKFQFNEWGSICSVGGDTTGHCGTTGCIAGAALQFAHPDDVRIQPDTRRVMSRWVDLGIGDVSSVAGELLGLSNQQCALLFYPFDIFYYSLDAWGHEYHSMRDCPLSFTCGLPPESIAKVLQHFNDTGVIDWYIAKEEQEA